MLDSPVCLYLYIKNKRIVLMNNNEVLNTDFLVKDMFHE